MFIDRKLEPGAENAQIFAEVVEYAIYQMDRRGVILSWNRGAQRITGYAEEEALGKSYGIFSLKEDLETRLPEQQLDEAARVDGYVREGWRLKKDGSRFYANFSITALRGDNGDLQGFLSIVADLTNKKVAEDESRMRSVQLQESVEALRKSEEKYHNMIAEIPDYAIILLDNDGTIIDWNKGAEKIKLYKPSEIIGRNFRTFYSGEDREGRLPESLLDEARREGSVNHEGWRVRKDGTRFWGFVSISALHDQQGEIIGFSKVTRDLTERKRAEDRMSASAEVLRQANEALRQSEEQYHKMIAEVRDYAIILLDKEGNIQNWNVGAEQIKQYSTREAIGKNFRIFYGQEDREEGLPERLLAEAESRGKAMHEGWRVKKDGTRFWGSVVITALHNANGHLLGFSKVTRDLTARKQAEDDLRENALKLDQKNKMLERLNEELESFNYVASHDLKEPLRKIQTFVNFIERNNDVPPGSAAYIEKIKQSAAKSHQLIEDLLSLSRVSNDRSRFQMVDLNGVLAHTIEELDLLIKEKSARIVNEPLPSISGVSFQIEQLFANLVSNGLKFSSGEPFIKIKYSLGEFASPDNEMVTCHQISIVDNGIGFEQQHALLIFGAFQRLETDKGAGGTGIGLAIVKKVMQNHGGWVSAEGRPNEGATFNLFFPAVAALSSANTNSKDRRGSRATGS